MNWLQFRGWWYGVFGMTAQKNFFLRHNKFLPPPRNSWIGATASFYPWECWNRFLVVGCLSDLPTSADYRRNAGSGKPLQLIYAFVPYVVGRAHLELFCTSTILFWQLELHYISLCRHLKLQIWENRAWWWDGYVIKNRKPRGCIQSFGNSLWGWYGEMNCRGRSLGVCELGHDFAWFEAGLSNDQGSVEKLNLELTSTLDHEKCDVLKNWWAANKFAGLWIVSEQIWIVWSINYLTYF